MAFFGLVIEESELEEEAPDDAFEVWPENAETVRVFMAMETQWCCVGSAGGLWVAGLRYEALVEALWQACRVKRKRRGKVVRGLRVMELAALPLLNGQDSA